MRNLFKPTFILKTGVLILVVGIFIIPSIWRLFPENRNLVVFNDFAVSESAFAEPGTEPEPSNQDTMTYGQFRKIEDRQKLIRLRHKLASQASGGGTEIGPIGIRSVNSCDSCVGSLVSGDFDAAPFQYYLVLQGYYLDPKIDCYSWNGKNYVFGPGHSEMKEASFRFSYSDYANRLINRKGALLMPIGKKTHDILNPVFWVLLVGAIFFLYHFYFSIPLQILIRISNGQVFTDQNIRQLKWLAGALIAPPFITLLFKYSITALIRKQLVAGVYVSFAAPFEFSAIPYIAALVVFGIIVAFREGQKLQKDQDLTI